MSPITIIFLVSLAASQETLRKVKVDESSVVLDRKVSRSQDDGAITELTMEVARQVSCDPIALTCGLLMLAYFIGQMLLPNVEAKGPAFEPVGKIRKGSVCSSPEKRGRARSAKSSFAISINQRLMQLHTVDEILDYALFHAGRTDIVNVVTAIHRSAKMAAHVQRRQLGGDKRVADLLVTLQEFLTDDNLPVRIMSRAVGNTSWALAKMQFKGYENPILGTLQQRFTEHATSFKPEELMNTVWAFAELRHDTKEGQARALEVAKASVSCLGNFHDFSLQQVVYFAWALARLASSGLVRSNEEVAAGMIAFKAKIVERVRPDVAQLTTKNISMISWGMAQICLHLQLKPEKQEDVMMLLSDVATNVVGRDMRNFVPGELASVVWALNKCHVEHPVFFTAFKNHATKFGLKGYNSQDLANVLCAFVNMGAGDDNFIVALGSAIEQNAASFNRLERMMVQWAFSQCPHLAAPKLDKDVQL